VATRIQIELPNRIESNVESGTWIVLGSIVVVALMAYFCRAPRSPDVATESLSKRWFG